MSQHDLRIRGLVWPVLGALLLLVSIYLLSIPGYILFHSLAEIFAIIIGCAVFTLTWNTRRFVNNDYLLFVGIALLAASVINALHALSYKGMGVFGSEDANLPTQLWIARRYLESIALLAALLFLRRTLNAYVALLAFGGITALLLAAIFGQAFPAAYIEGVGLTPFKIVSEYVIAGLFVAAAYGLYRQRRRFEPDISRALIWSLVIAAGAELLFTTYVGVYDLTNRLGHFLTIVSYYLVYVAIVRTGIVRPYKLLEHSREQLRSLSHHLVNLQEAERKDLSRELHDRSGQSMTALKLTLFLLKRRPDDPNVVRAQVDELIQMADGVMAELHDLAVNLRPSALDRYGLVPALEQYLSSFRKQNQMQVEFVAAGLDGERLPEDVETAVYRIVQESLTNVARHAEATHVSVDVHAATAKSH